MGCQICLLPISILIFCFLHPLSAATGRGCSLSVSENPNEKHLPILLHNHTKDFTLVVPKQGHINLNFGDGLTLLCPNPRNLLNATNSNSSFATCNGNNTLKISRKSYDFNGLLCKKQIQANIRVTTRKCGNEAGKLINIGYQVDRHHFVTLIKVCYDAVNGNTLYTEHTLHGAEIEYASKISDRPSFSTSGLGSQIAADVAFKKSFQKSRFNQLLGAACAHEPYINARSFLARGHLSPDADFLLASAQFSTYFYINVCPQWQTINGGNWLSVENVVRRTAEHYRDEFKIITGTHDILQLPNETCKPTPIFLISGHKLPVPKFIWKIMYHEKSHMGIVFLSLNNPFVNEITEEDVLCRSICEEYGWGSDNWSNIKKGFVYCCDVRELAGKVQNMPHLRVTGVLVREL